MLAFHNSFLQNYHLQLTTNTDLLLLFFFTELGEEVGSLTSLLPDSPMDPPKGVKLIEGEGGQGWDGGRSDESDNK